MGYYTHYFADGFTIEPGIDAHLSSADLLWFDLTTEDNSDVKVVDGQMVVVGSSVTHVTERFEDSVKLYEGLEDDLNKIVAAVNKVNGVVARGAYIEGRGEEDGDHWRMKIWTSVNPDKNVTQWRSQEAKITWVDA